jgi:hypothetical protein
MFRRHEDPGKSPGFTDRYHRRFRRPNWMRFRIWTQVFRKWFLNSRGQQFLPVYTSICGISRKLFGNTRELFLKSNSALIGQMSRRQNSGGVTIGIRRWSVTCSPNLRLRRLDAFAEHGCHERQFPCGAVRVTRSVVYGDSHLLRFGTRQLRRLEQQNLLSESPRTSLCGSTKRCNAGFPSATNLLLRCRCIASAAGRLSEERVVRC